MLQTVNVTVRVSDQNGQAVAGARVHAALSHLEVDAGAGYVQQEPVTAVADTAGIAILALWPNALGMTESYYTVTLTNPDTGKSSLLKATIPNRDCDLHLVAQLPPYPGKKEGELALDTLNQSLTLVLTKTEEAAGSAQQAAAAVDTLTGQLATHVAAAHPHAQYALAEAVAASLAAKVDIVAGKGLSEAEFTAAEKSKLAGVDTGATANDTDANLKARANHTGEQAIGTVTGLQVALDGKADLVDGKVQASQLPSYVDDVLEYADYAALPATGEAGKIYVLAAPYTSAGVTSSQFRWSGTAYAPIIASPGSTDAVTEGASNLYHTASRVLGTVLAGLSTAAGTVVNGTHTVLQAIGFLQKQVSDLDTNKANKSGEDFTGPVSFADWAQHNQHVAYNFGKRTYYYDPTTTTWVSVGSPSAGLLTISNAGGDLVSITSTGIQGAIGQDASAAGSFTTAAVNNKFAAVNGDLSAEMGVGGGSVCYIGTNSAHPVVLMYGGAEKARITSTGFQGAIGQGTRNVGHFTELSSSRSTDNVVTVTSTGTTTAAALALINGDGTTSAKYSYHRFFNNDTNGQDWRIGTYGSDEFRIYDAKVGTTVGLWNSLGYNGPIGQSTRYAGGFDTVRINDGKEIGWGDNSTFIYGNAALGLVRIFTAGNERVRVDSLGNLGLSVAPSAWGTTLGGSPLRALSILSANVFSASGYDAGLAYNAYRLADGSFKYQGAGGNAPVRLYLQDNTGHKWHSAPSGVADNPVPLVQDMTLDASGNLGLGVTPSAWGISGNAKAIELPATALRSFSDSTGELLTNTYHNGTGYVYRVNYPALRYEQYAADGSHTWYTAPSGTAGAPITWTQAMTLDANGNLLLGATSGSNHVIHKTGIETSTVLEVRGNTTNRSGLFISVDAEGWSGSAAALYVGKNSVNGRSINAGGTINASGADYAEYMRKAVTCGEIKKGAIVGVNAAGELTDKWAEAVSFLIKSTDPSYVGGDTWGSEEALGMVRPTDTEAEDYAERLTAFDAALEAARAKVDRIAYAGQVPVNVYGANVGDYIVPVQDGEDIKGVAIAEDGMTLKQYMKAVGIVQNILPDGRANVRVKVC